MRWRIIAMRWMRPAAESFGIKRNAVDQMKSRMMTKLREIVESLKPVV